jgi:hypothetical protein
VRAACPALEPNLPHHSPVVWQQAEALAEIAAPVQAALVPGGESLGAVLLVRAVVLRPEVKVPGTSRSGAMEAGLVVLESKALVTQPVPLPELAGLHWVPVQVAGLVVAGLSGEGRIGRPEKNG